MTLIQYINKFIFDRPINNIKNQIFHGYGLRGGTKKSKKCKLKNLKNLKKKKSSKSKKKKSYRIQKRTIKKKCYT